MRIRRFPRAQVRFLPGAFSTRWNDAGLQDAPAAPPQRAEKRLRRFHAVWPVTALGSNQLKRGTDFSDTRG